MRSAIMALWNDMMHGDVKHQEWLRNKLIIWAKGEFGLELEEWEFPILDDTFYKNRGKSE